MRVAPGVLCLGLVLAACSGETTREGAGEPVEQPTTPTAELTTDPTGGSPVAEEPLVLAVGATRPVEDVPVRAARRLVRTGASTWAALGQTGDDLRVLTGGLPDADAVPGAEQLTDAARALRDVRRESVWSTSRGPFRLR